MTMAIIGLAGAIIVGMVVGGWLMKADLFPVIKTKIHNNHNSNLEAGDEVAEILVQCTDGSRKWLITSLVGSGQKIPRRKEDNVPTGSG